MRVLDLFSGIGGFTLGLHAAGANTIGFVEAEPFCRAVLAKRFPGVPCYADVRGFHPRDYGLTPDLVCGGFPCTDISLAGKGAGLRGVKSGLWFELRRIVEETCPPWVLIENVSALRSRGLDCVLGGLAALGYDALWNCIPASAVGAPHRRDRIWIVAHDNRNGCAPERLRRVQHGIGEALGDDAHRRDSARRAATYATEFGGRARGIGRGGSRELGALSSDGASRTRRVNANASGGRRHIPGEGEMEQPGRAEALGPGPTDSHHHHQDAQDGRLYRPARLSDWWQAEPGVAGVVYGLSGGVDRHRWMHRLHSLGNSLVPQLAQIHGEAILAVETSTHKTCEPSPVERLCS